MSEQLSWQDGTGEKAGPVRGRLQAQDSSRDRVAPGAGQHCVGTVLGAVFSPAHEK